MLLVQSFSRANYLYFSGQVAVFVSRGVLLALFDGSILLDDVGFGVVS